MPHNHLTYNFHETILSHAHFDKIFLQFFPQRNRSQRFSLNHSSFFFFARSRLFGNLTNSPDTGTIDTACAFGHNDFFVIHCEKASTLLFRVETMIREHSKENIFLVALSMDDSKATFMSLRQPYTPFHRSPFVLSRHFLFYQ